MPNQASFKKSIFHQAADKLELPVSAVYGALVMVILLSILIVTSQASLSQQQTVSQARYETVGCNQPCINNRYCQPNHFCYQRRCRLAGNPEDETCAGIASTQDSRQKGYDPSSQDQANPDDGTADSTQAADQAQQLDTADRLQTESPLSRLSEILEKGDASMFLIIGLGLIGLVIIIAISSLISGASGKRGQTSTISKKNPAPPKPDFSSLEKEDKKEITLEKTKKIE